MVVHGLYGSSGSHASQFSVRMSDMRPDSMGSCGEIESASFDSVLAESVLWSKAAAILLSSGVIISGRFGSGVWSRRWSLFSKPW